MEQNSLCNVSRENYEEGTLLGNYFEFEPLVQMLLIDVSFFLALVASLFTKL